MARMNTEFGRTVVTVTDGEYAIIAQIAMALRRGGEDGLRALLSTQTTDSRMLVYGGVATYDHRLSAQIEQNHPGLVQGLYRIDLYRFDTNGPSRAAIYPSENRWSAATSHKTERRITSIEPEDGLSMIISMLGLAARTGETYPPHTLPLSVLHLLHESAESPGGYPVPAPTMVRAEKPLLAMRKKYRSDTRAASGRYPSRTPLFTAITERSWSLSYAALWDNEAGDCTDIIHLFAIPDCLYEYGAPSDVRNGTELLELTPVSSTAAVTRVISWLPHSPTLDALYNAVSEELA